MASPALENLLAESRQAGEWDSTGSFTLDLAEARRKLGAHAQVDPRLWSFKLVQAFTALGCTHLEVEACWRMRARGAARGLDLEKLAVHLAAAGLTEGNKASAERYLAVALVGLGALSLESAAYQGGSQQVDNLLSQDPPRPVAAQEDITLELRFADPRLSAFPLDLWRRSLMFCPMRVTFRGEELNQPECPLRGPYWYEAVQLSSAGVGLWGLGEAEVELGQPLGLTGKRRCRMRWAAGEGMEGELVLRVRPLLEGDSQFIPVIAGVPLQPLNLEGCPPGLEIIFAADNWPTDISQFNLRRSPELETHLHALAVQAKDMLAHFFDGISHADTVFASQRPRRSLPLDLLAVGGTLLLLAALLCEAVHLGSLGWDPDVPNEIIWALFLVPALYFLNEPKSRRATFAGLKAEYIAALQRTIHGLK